MNPSLDPVQKSYHLHQMSLGNYAHHDKSPLPLVLALDATGLQQYKPKPFSHKSIYVAAAIVHFVQNLYKPSMRTAEQQHAIDVYHILREDSAECQPDAFLMKSYFDIFNELFFFGSLGPCELVFHHHSVEKVSGMHQISTTLSHRQPTLLPKDTLCRIVLWRCHEYENSPQPIKGYLGTLLHEMVHAALALYVCMCDKKCQQDATNSDGWTGHGHMWMRTASTIQVACDDILGELLNLDIRDCAAHEDASARQYIASLPVTPQT
jgi:hypothetical protein